MDITPAPSSFEALRRAANIPDLSADDGPKRYFEAYEEHWGEMRAVLAELYRTNPPCPCGAMTINEADERKHHCLPATAPTSFRNLDSDPGYDYGMPVHPVCELFPLMDDERIETLQHDIEQNGLLNPVVVHEGQLLDGRSRIRACQRAKPQVQPSYVECREIYKGPQSISRWIWSQNAQRRHLTVDQYVAAEVAIRDWEEQHQEARQKQIEAGKRGGKEGGRRKKKTPETNSSQGFPEQEELAAPRRAPQARTQIANDLGVSEHKVQQAINIHKTDPELLKQVANGTVPNLRKAEKQVKKKQIKKNGLGWDEPLVGVLPADLPGFWPQKQVKKKQAEKKQIKKKQERPASDLEKGIRRVMRAVDSWLESSPDEQREEFLSQLIATLERMK